MLIVLIALSVLLWYVIPILCMTFASLWYHELFCKNWSRSFILVTIWSPFYHSKFRCYTDVSWEAFLVYLFIYIYKTLPLSLIAVKTDSTNDTKVCLLKIMVGKQRGFLEIYEGKLRNQTLTPRVKVFIITIQLYNNVSHLLCNNFIWIQRIIFVGKYLRAIIKLPTYNIPTYCVQQL